MAEWKTPLWTDPQPVLISSLTIKTRFTPSVLGFANTLFCVWIQDEISDGTQKLQFSVSERDPAVLEPPECDFFAQRAWSEVQPVKLPGCDGIQSVIEQACATPALAALEGRVHMVFPDENRNLVHLQYVENSGSRGWGHRVGVLAGTAESPCLAAFGGKLWCVYRALNTNELCSATWHAINGWSKPSKINNIPDCSGQRALFELNAKLQLLFTTYKGQAKKIDGMFLKPNGEWGPLLETGLPLDTPSTSGVNAACIKSLAFLVYSTDSKVTIRQFSAGKWQDSQQRKSTTITAPAIAILDNEVICFWPNDKQELQVSSRKALALPNLGKWMSAIDDSVPVSNLTIPGTHDAAAWTMVYFAGTQSVSIGDQLDMGIRYLDLRAAYPRKFIFSTSIRAPDTTKPLCAYHNRVPLRHTNGDWLTIESIFNSIYTWMDQNPSEGVMIQIKQDNGTNYSDAAAKFPVHIAALINKNKNRWLLGATIPMMKDLRGRIQLVRRFDLPSTTNAYGIDVSGPTWDDPKGFLVRPDGGPRVQLQDHWNLSDQKYTTANQVKWKAVHDCLEAAKNDPDREALYINFSSANGVGIGVSPYMIALGFHDINWSRTGSDIGVFYEGVNKKLATFFNDEVQGPGRYGVILMDYPQYPEEMMAAIVNTNTDKFGKK